MVTALTVFRKDLRIQFCTIPIYAACAIFLVITGYFFYWELSYFSLICYQLATSPHLDAQGINLTESMLGTFFMNAAVLLLLLLPVVTMRAFASERREGTLETLLTYPAWDWEILLGKFFSALVAGLFLTTPTLFFIWFAKVAGGSFDGGVLLSAYVGIVLLSAVFVALGIFMSFLTTSTLLGTALSFGFLILFWVIGWGAEMSGPFWGSIFKEISVFEHYRNFTKGHIHLRDVSYFILVCVFLLIFTKEWMGTRRWSK